MLRESFKEALKDAMRAKDQRRVSTIRLITAALKDRDIAARPSGNMDGISDADILSMLQGMIKQRRESAELYEKGGRPELARQENEEIAIIERFLPKQMDEGEVKAAIAEAVAAVGALSVKDMGKVMGELKAKFAGRMDYSKVGGEVKKALAGG